VVEFKSLAEVIKESREKLGVSIRELARQIEVSAPFLSDIELGRRFPSDEVLARLAKTLKMPIEALKKHDTRVSIGSLKKLIDTSPTWSFALRTVAEKATEGKLTAEDLLKKLNSKSL
jgi:transcriptional regulator with XRE-family HTH domain